MKEITHLCQAVHQNAVDHGFWDSPRDPAALIALMHSELSEALEAMRAKDGTPVGNHGLTSIPSDHIPEFSGVAEELADCVIRIMDFCGAYKIDLGAAILAKHEYNTGREYKHGKKF